MTDRPATSNYRGLRVTLTATDHTRDGGAGYIVQLATKAKGARWDEWKAAGQFQWTTDLAASSTEDALCVLIESLLSNQLPYQP